MATLGNNIKAYVRATQNNTSLDEYTWLGGEQSNSLNRTAEAVETSDKSSNWAQFIAGKRGATIEVTVFADPEDEAQEASIAALVEGARVEYAIGSVEDDAIEFGDFGYAIVTAVSDTNDSNAVASRTISLTATGQNNRQATRGNRSMSAPAVSDNDAPEGDNNNNEEQTS